MAGTSDSRGNANRSPGSNSYLVRVWRENGAEAKVRFYLRDLKTGEERYLGDPDRIGEVLRGGFLTEESRADRRQGLG